MELLFRFCKHPVLQWFESAVFCLFFLNISADADGQEIKPVRVGILTDCQYCNCETEGIRNYMLSLPKLDSCIKVFNALSLDAIFHLGDMIDHNYRSYDSVIPRFQQFNPPINLVLGNHDYVIKNKFKPGLLDRLGMKEDYYVVDLGNWRFIVLNGDDLSFFAPQDKKHKEERNDVVYDQFQQMHVNGLPWNGGIGRDQLKWLEKQLEESEQSQKKVIVVCHFPLFVKDNHNLFNNKVVFRLISGYSCVKAYFNGHYHSGNYQMKEGIHMVNFKGMVNTTINAFAVVTLT
ncbi:MAG: metallophosphoesterase, partial [Bacteroidota bacterium]